MGGSLAAQARTEKTPLVNDATEFGAVINSRRQPRFATDLFLRRPTAGSERQASAQTSPEPQTDPKFIPASPTRQWAMCASAKAISDRDRHPEERG
jgi:hypothetical protein